MSTSLSRSSKMSSASSSAQLHLETEVFSDDSGVDVKPQSHNALQDNASRRNKRKSTEPKKRKDVLQMKRFRWDTDEEELDRDHEDTFEAIETERPGSGDSGCQLEAPVPAPLLTVQVEKKKRPRQWRKPKVDKGAKVDSPAAPVFRQSVIRKHEASPSTSAPDSQPSVSGLAGPSIVQKVDFDESQDDSSDPFARTLGEGPSRSAGRPRNYKSMSRQRRIEANARERTRVHTISAAFESLRRAVPAYAHNQKLSKLAILRIASAYIVALACLNKQDYSQEQSQPDLADCVEQCTRTIQAEGRSRRRSSKE